MTGRVRCVNDGAALHIRTGCSLVRVDHCYMNNSDMMIISFFMLFVL